MAHRAGQPGPNVAHGASYAIALGAMQATQSLCQHHFWYRSMMVGAKARAALASLIYQKSLVLSHKVRFILVLV